MPNYGVQVLTESLRVPVECYLTCPGPVPLFSGSLGLLTTEPSAAAQCLQEHGMAVLQVLRWRANAPLDLMDTTE